MATRSKRAPKAPAETGAAFQELGTSGTAIHGGYVVTLERNAKAVGQQRYVEASNILANISIAAASLRYFLNLVAKAKWKVSPASDKPEAKQAAEFVESVLVDMLTHWSRIVRRTGMYRFHGFSVGEWTAKRRADGKIGFADIESRPQKTILRWSQDEGGTIDGVFQRSPQTGQEIPLPRWKLIYLVDDVFTDSPEGMGWFRHLLEPSERLTQYLKLEGIGFERDLAGIPVGRAPITALKQMVKDGKLTKADADAAIEVMRKIVRLQVKKEDTGVVLDSQHFIDKTNDGQRVSAVAQWGLELLTGSSTSMAALGAAVERLERQMARIMGTESLMLGSGNGSLALATNKSDALSLNVNSTLIDMAGFMSHDIVDPIWILNGFDDELKPQMGTEDVAFRDVQQVTAALRDMATAGAILAPNDPAINDVRELLGISPQEELNEEDLALMAALRGTPPGGQGDQGGQPGDGGAGDAGKPGAGEQK